LAVTPERITGPAVIFDKVAIMLQVCCGQRICPCAGSIKVPYQLDFEGVIRLRWTARVHKLVLNFHADHLLFADSLGLDIDTCDLGRYVYNGI
jgi:hypothetical protein